MSRAGSRRSALRRLGGNAEHGAVNQDTTIDIGGDCCEEIGDLYRAYARKCTQQRCHAASRTRAIAALRPS